MISSKHILLKDNNITLHMMAHTYCLPSCYENSDACFPNFGTARTPYLIYDVYTNDSPHGVCFPTVYLLHILKLNGQNLIKFCILIITDKIYVGIVCTILSSDSAMAGL